MPHAKCIAAESRAASPVLHTLANGVRLLAIPMPHVQSASVSVFLRVGSRDETPQTNGIGHDRKQVALLPERRARLADVTGRRLRSASS